MKNIPLGVLGCFAVDQGQQSTSRPLLSSYLVRIAGEEWWQIPSFGTFEISKRNIAEDENESSRGISKTNQYSSSIDRRRRERVEDERLTTPVRSITPPITIRAIDASNMKDGGITRISKRPCANILLRFPCPSAMGSDLAEVIIQRRPGRRSNHRSSSRDETSTG